MAQKKPFKDFNDFKQQCCKINDPNLGDLSVNHSGLLWLNEFALIDSGLSLGLIKLLKTGLLIHSADTTLPWEITKTSVMSNPKASGFVCRNAISGCLRKNKCKKELPYIYDLMLDVEDIKNKTKGAIAFCYTVSSMSGAQLKFVSEASDVAHTLKELKTLVETGLRLTGFPSVPYQIPIELEKKPASPSAFALTTKEIYEANKTCNFCVNCGKPTELKALLSSSIRYCPCVDQS